MEEVIIEGLRQGVVKRRIVFGSISAIGPSQGRHNAREMP